MAKTTVTRPRKKFGTIILEVFKNSAVPAVKDEVEQYAQDIVERLRDRIRSQDFHFKAKYNQEYLERKAKEGYGSIPLIRTEQYVNSITKRETPYGWIVGVEHINHVSDNGEVFPMIDLAKSLEFGTHVGPERAKKLHRSAEEIYMPARPHWRSTLREVNMEKDNIKKKWTKTMNKTAQKALKEYLKDQRTSDIMDEE